MRIDFLETIVIVQIEKSVKLR